MPSQFKVNIMVHSQFAVNKKAPFIVNKSTPFLPLLYSLDLFWSSSILMFMPIIFLLGIRNITLFNTYKLYLSFDKDIVRNTRCRMSLFMKTLIKTFYSSRTTTVLNTRSTEHRKHEFIKSWCKKKVCQINWFVCWFVFWFSEIGLISYSMFIKNKIKMIR